MNEYYDSRRLDMAEQQYQRGQFDAAIETLTRALGEDPDDSDAHGFLALCLLKRKRLYAAALEAQRATELEPESLLAHLASAGVATAQHRFRQAEHHLTTAGNLYPEAAAVYDQLARLYVAWGRDEEAAVNNLRACELAPEDVDHRALRAWLDLRHGNRREAEQHARAALEMDPENVDALCVLGHCELASGNAQAAREHAAWALQIDPMDERALTLLGAVKARQSLTLGLWWRFQSFVSAGSRTRTIVLLLGMFLLYRIAMIALDENEMDNLLGPLSYAWLGFVAYTWFAPGLFWKSVRRELRQVRLRPDF